MPTMCCHLPRRAASLVSANFDSTSLILSTYRITRSYQRPPSSCTRGKCSFQEAAALMRASLDIPNSRNGGKGVYAARTASSRAGLLSHGGYGASHGGSGGQGGDISIENCNYHVYTDLSTSGGCHRKCLKACISHFGTWNGVTVEHAAATARATEFAAEEAGSDQRYGNEALTISQNAFISADGAPSNTEGSF